MPDSNAAAFALLRAIGIVLHELGNVVIVYRTAIRPLRQRCEDFPGARFRRLGLVFSRIADHDAVAAGRGTEALYIKGAQKLKRTHAVRTVLPAAGSINLQLIVGFGKALPPECYADLVRSGRRLELDVFQTGVDPIQRAVHHLIEEFVVFFAADLGLVDDLVIDGDHHRVLVLHLVAPQAVGHVGNVDAVLAIGREIHFRENAAPCPQR